MKMDGEVVGINDLPAADEKRWVTRRKALVLAAVESGLLTEEEVLTRYRMSADEFRLWADASARHGRPGLRATRAQEYACTAHARALPQTPVEAGDIEIDRPRRLLRISGRAIRVTQKECDILALLAVNAGSAVSRQIIMDSLYGGSDCQPDQKIIDVFMSKLRKKIAHACPDRTIVETVWGRGYVLVP